MGGVAGAIVGPSDTPQMAPFANGLIVREGFLHKQLVKELWSQFIHPRVRDFPSSKAIQFVETREATSFVNIDPTEVLLIPLNDSSPEALTPKMKMRVLFYDKNKTLWGEEQLVASIGEYTYDRWKESRAQLVKEAIDNGIPKMAIKLIADLRNISQSTDGVIPVEAPPLQSNEKKDFPWETF